MNCDNQTIMIFNTSVRFNHIRKIRANINDYQFTSPWFRKISLLRCVKLKQKKTPLSREPFCRYLMSIILHSELLL